MEENGTKKIIGVQVDKEIDEALYELSLEYGSSVSAVIRMILIDYLKRYTDYKPKRKERK